MIFSGWNLLQGAKEPAGQPARQPASVATVALPAEAPAAVPHAAAPPNDADILDAYESLGDVCEFGTVQKRGGVDRLALFKWAGVPVVRLAEVIETDLVGVDDPRWLLLRPEDRPDGTQEYQLDHYFLETPMHTFVQVGTIAEQELFARQVRRMTMLRRKWLEDAKAARRIYVYRSRRPLDLADLVRLHRALCQHGPNRLLYVREATEDLPAGEVRLHHPGFAEGAIDRLAVYEAAAEPRTAMWPQLLRAGHKALCGDAPVEVFA